MAALAAAPRPYQTDTVPGGMSLPTMTVVLAYADRLGLTRLVAALQRLPRSEYYLIAQKADEQESGAASASTDDSTDLEKEAIRLFRRK